MRRPTSRRRSRQKRLTRPIHRKQKKHTQKRQRGGDEPKVFHLYNIYHYGDNILNLKFLYNISEILKNKGISIKYYYDTEYNKNKIELEKYVHPSGVVTLHSMHEKPADAHNLWMGENIGDVSNLTFDKYYNLFYQRILNILSLSNEGINTSLYQPEPYLEDIYEKLDNKFKDLDVLVINANSNSLMMPIDQNYFNTLSDNLSKKFKIATTVAVNDSISSTLRDSLSMQDIGAISTHAKYIVSVYTGPITTCFTEATKKSVKKWFIFVNNPTTFEDINAVIISNFDDISQVENEIK